MISNRNFPSIIGRINEVTVDLQSNVITISKYKMRVHLNMLDLKMATDAIVEIPKIDSFQLIQKNATSHAVVTRMNYAEVLGA